MTFEIGFILITSISAAVWLGFIFLVKDIKPLYPPPGSDSERTTRIAAGSNRWKWPSDMHTSAQSSSYMKDVTVILLAFSQKIFRDKKSLFPITALHSFCAAVSAILIYLITASFWNPATGLISSLVFLGSFWPWQISLFVGHVNVATMFFLAAIYCLIGASVSPIYALVSAGILTGLLFFSSSSSFKYILPLGAAFIFAEYKNIFSAADPLSWPITIFSRGWIWSPAVFFMAVLLPFLAVKKSYRKIIGLAYQKKGPAFLRRIMPMKGAENTNLEHYISKADKKLAVIQKIAIILWLLLSALGYFAGWPDLLIFLSGIAVVVLSLTLPNIGRSLGFYLEYVWYHANQRTGLVTGFIYFKDYFEKYFKARGKPVPERMRAGLKWLPRFYFRIAPVHLILWLSAAFFLLIIFLKNPSELFKTGIIAAVSLSPIIWGEATKSPQLSRTYFPGFIGMLLLIGQAFFIISSSDLFWPVALSVLAVVYPFNAWKFFSDVYPARMTINKIVAALDRLNIKEFYTPRTGYQYALIEAIEPSIRERYNIKYIDKLDNIDRPDGWLLIPGMSSKTAMPEIDEIKNNLDLTEDPKLNRFIESREIERIAEGKFKTFGTSDIYVHEGEVPSYRDLMLREITDQDRFYGYAWLVRIENISEYLNRPVKV